MESLEILKHSLTNIKEFSETDFNEDDFQRIVGELKATMHKLRSRIPNEEQLSQIEYIIGFKIISQKHPIEEFFIKYLFAPSKYVWPNLRWNKKGKYVYDLDQLELQLGGLIYKIEQDKPL